MMNGFCLTFLTMCNPYRVIFFSYLLIYITSCPTGNQQYIQLLKKAAGTD
jgi:hypothetical protein